MRSQARIVFRPDGTIVDANRAFLQTVGYQRSDIVGRNHSMFVDPIEAAGEDYTEFWNALRRGELQAAEFRRLGRGDREVWIQATYTPICGLRGQVRYIVKLATDVTKRKQSQRQVQDRSQALIEFKPDGTILGANDLFLSCVGYPLEEIRGAHHRIFMPPGQADTPEYAEFWSRLAAGEYRQGEFQRVSKAGDEIWLRGVYNPIFGTSGEVVRVVKAVSDITEEVSARHAADEVGADIARGVTDLSTSTDELANAFSRTAVLASEVEAESASAAQTAKELDTKGVTVEAVSHTIQALAKQTNLLALNATIEAARAGAAGHGFTVVAKEVKQLANATSAAANDIGATMQDIKSGISNVTSSITTIASTATDVTSMATQAATALEEQSAVMAGMRHSAQRLLHADEIAVAVPTPGPTPSSAADEAGLLPADEAR
ncbi:MAG: PAS domain-containing methyl-accepting chemotaxis protein [Actinomycetota bacterium]